MMKISNKYHITNTIVVVFILIINIVVYSPVSDHKFLNWDDESYVLENDILRKKGRDLIETAFLTDEVVGNYHPLTVLSLALDFKLGKLNPKVFHWHNLILHVLNSILLYFFLLHFFKHRNLAVFITLFFSIHPMHVEVVNWVSSRKDLLSTFYLFTALNLYIGRSSKIKMILVYLSFLLACLSKATMVVIPVALSFIDLYKGELNRFNIFRTLPFYLTSLVFGLVAISSQESSDAFAQIEGFSLIKQLSFASFSLVEMMLKSIWPYNLSCFHPYPLEYLEDFKAEYYISLLIFPFCIFGLVISFKNDRRLFFGLGFFLIFIFLLLKFSVLGRALYAERYTYVPYVGIGIILYHLLDQLKMKNYKFSLLFILLAYYGLQSYSYSKTWKTGETLWGNTIQSYPDNYFGYSCRGDYYLKDGQFQKSLADFNQCLSLYPDYYEAYESKGIAFIRLNNLDSAEVNFKKIIAFDSTYSDAYFGLTEVYMGKNQIEEAFEMISKASRQDPANYIYRLNKGVVAEQLGTENQAIRAYTEAIALDSTQFQAFRYRGSVFMSQGLLEASKKDLLKANSLHPKDPIGNYLLFRLFKASDIKLAQFYLKKAKLYGFKLTEEEERLIQAI